MIDVLKPDSFPPILTEADAARMISMSIEWLRNGRYTGDGPPYLKIGVRTVRYERDAVLNFMRRYRVENERPAV
jgi:hypothetical protein